MKLKRWAILLVFIILVFGSGCRPTPINARKFEELKGTYSLSVYYAVEDGKDERNLIDSFDFFYFIIDENAVAWVIYRSEGESEYKAFEYNYTLKYKSGSTEYIDEIKLRFHMPHSTMEGGLTVNYFTVSPNDRLVCQKITYENKFVVYLALDHVSSDSTFNYVESELGFNIENIEEYSKNK